MFRLPREWHLSDYDANLVQCSWEARSLSREIAASQGHNPPNFGLDILLCSPVNK